MGMLIALAVRAPRSFAPERVARVHALAGTGLAGDRHTDPGSPRQVLLASYSTYLDLDLPPFALRENLLLDIDTASLASGTLLRVGANVTLRLSFQCEACGYLDKHQPGLSRAIGNRRGVLARVLVGGEMGEGDPVEVLAQRLPALSEDWRERVLHVLGALPPGMVVEYAQLARLAGVDPVYCRAFPRLLAKLGYAGKAISARSESMAPRWDGAGLYD